MQSKKVLILGGTRDARQLAFRLIHAGHDVTTSFAGVTEHPVQPEGKVRVGGFGKMVKLAQGAMDLHSGRSQVDFAWLAERAPEAMRADVLAANTAQHVLEMVGPSLAEKIAQEALQHVKRVLESSSVADVIIVDRAGKIIAHAK